MKKITLSESNKEEVFAKIAKFLNKKNKEYSFLAVDYTSDQGSFQAIDKALSERNVVLESTFANATFDPTNETEGMKLASIAVDEPITGRGVATNLCWGDSIFLGRKRLIVFSAADKRLVNIEKDPVDILVNVPEAKLGKLFEITLN